MGNPRVQKFKAREFWKYRVRDYRVIATIQDGQMRTWGMRIGNRREADYRSTGRDTSMSRF